MSTQLYACTFNSTTFNTIPSFGFAINDFRLGSLLTHIYFFSQTSNLTSKSALIQITTDASTVITKFSISYIVIWNLNNIYFAFRQYNNVFNKLYSANKY